MSRHLNPVIAIIANQLGYVGEQWDEDSNLSEDCALDSLDRAEVVLVIEDEFGVEIEDESAASWSTIGDVCRFLDENVEASDYDPEDVEV